MFHRPELQEDHRQRCRGKLSTTDHQEQLQFIRFEIEGEGDFRGFTRGG